MKITQQQNTITSAGTEDTSKNQRVSRHNRDKENKNKTSFFAGNIMMNKQDSIAQKSALAQRKALKVVMNQFKGDNSIDEELTARQESRDHHIEESSKIEQEIHKINPTDKSLMEVYNVDADSKEQKDLELLQKQERSKQTGSKVKLTEEEKDQIKNMGAPTEYQSAVLATDEFNRRLKSEQAGADEDGAVIDGIKKALLKQHGMVDAKKEADSIMDAANKQIINTLISQSKDAVDAKYDDAKKKAEKAKQEKEEQDKKIEEQRAKREQEEAALADKTEKRDNLSDAAQSSSVQSGTKSSDTVSDAVQDTITKADSVHSQIQNDIQNMIKNQKLIEDDIKGLDVDQEV